MAHGGAGLVQHPQQAALLLLGAQGLGELQVAPGGEVQLHELPGGQPGQGGDVGQVGLLGLVEVGQQAPRRLDGQVPAGGRSPGRRELLLRRRLRAASGRKRASPPFSQRQSSFWVRKSVRAASAYAPSDSTASRGA